MGADKVYQQMLSGAVTAGTETAIGTVSGIKTLLFAHGACGNASLQAIRVSGGTVYVTASASGTAHAIICYTKEG